MPQSLAAANRRAAQQSRVDSLDSLGSNKSEFIQEEALSAMEVAVGDFIKRVQTNLDMQGMTVTGKSGDFSIEKTDTNINIYAAPWLMYQDRGVNGSVNRLYDTPFAYKTKRPPVQVFIDWIETKNIQLRNNAQFAGVGSDFEAIDVTQAAYSIRESVFRDGIAPTNVYSSEVERLIEDVGDSVIQVIYNSI